MNPINVMLGLWFVIGGCVLGRVISNALEVRHDRNKARKEWEQRTRKGVDIT